ncbi:hypothetical protein ACLB2K_063548 [Fragaria x ananassa]
MRFQSQIIRGDVQDALAIEWKFRVEPTEGGKVLFSFSDPNGKARVWKGGSWYFNRAPIALADYDGIDDVKNVLLIKSSYWITLLKVITDIALPCIGAHLKPADKAAATPLGVQIGLLFNSAFDTSMGSATPIAPRTVSKAQIPYAIAPTFATFATGEFASGPLASRRPRAAEQEDWKSSREGRCAEQGSKCRRGAAQQAEAAEQEDWRSSRVGGGAEQRSRRRRGAAQQATGNLRVRRFV